MKHLVMKALSVREGYGYLSHLSAWVCLLVSSRSSITECMPTSTGFAYMMLKMRDQMD
jgi:hypothetical protein